MPFSDAQRYMADQRIDGWLVYDFRNNNPIIARIVGKKLHLTRRVWWLLPQRGSPTILCSVIDESSFVAAGMGVSTYIGWADMQVKVSALLAGLGGRRVAMEYAPGGVLPTAGVVDAGTIEFVRSQGVEVVSSADVVQLYAAAWREKGLSGHRRASELTHGVMKDAWGFLGAELKKGPVQERAVQKFITGRFDALGLEYPDDPIVSVNANSGSPHYGPDEKHSSPIRPGDWVLIDLWARIPGDEHVYSDITWTGFCGSREKLPAEHLKVFNTVRDARSASVSEAQRAWKEGRQAEGWQLDEAARAVIIGAGYGQFIKHRTGHSLSPGALVHGIGMNLDNLETRDTRRMMPGTGFTVEPGVYTTAFGVRNEINVFVDPVSGPVVTSCVQDEPWCTG
ncbi:MAG TPA: M24 family metallopeptidase [Phycisphaerales bacterium]|nr:M24 family metallopeptidase [Phycisphaerales bacterium]